MIEQPRKRVHQLPGQFYVHRDLGPMLPT
jgi:hypothetical protein